MVCFFLYRLYIAVIVKRLLVTGSHGRSLRRTDQLIKEVPMVGEHFSYTDCIHHLALILLTFLIYAIIHNPQ